MKKKGCIGNVNWLFGVNCPLSATAKLELQPGAARSVKRMNLAHEDQTDYRWTGYSKVGFAPNLLNTYRLKF